MENDEKSDMEMKMKTRHTVGCGMLVTAMFCLGSSFIAAKSALIAFPDAMALFIRLTIAAAVLVPASMLYCERGDRPDGRAWTLIVVQAMIGVVLLNLLLFRGLAGTAASTAGIVFGLLPIVVAVMSAVLLHERLSVSGASAALLAAAASVSFGSGMIDDMQPDGGGMEATLLIVMAVLCAGCFTVAGKSLARTMSPPRIAAMVSVSALTMTAPLAAGDLVSFDYGGVSQTQWISVFWWSLSSGVLYSILLYAGLSRVDAGFAGVFTVVVPLTTLVISHVFLGEAISPGQSAGMACAVAGILLVVRSRREASPASQGASQPSDDSSGAAAGTITAPCRHRVA